MYMIDEMFSMSKDSYESFKELASINSKTMQKLMEIQMTLAQFGLESGVEQAKLLSKPTSLQEVISMESDFASSYGSKMLELARTTSTILATSNSEISAWLEKNVETTEGYFKKAA